MVLVNELLSSGLDSKSLRRKCDGFHAFTNIDFPSGLLVDTKLMNIKVALF